VFSAGLVGMLLGVILQGMIADRIGRKPVIVASVLLFGALTLAIARAESLTDLLVLRFVGGIGMGAAVPNIVTLTREYAPARMRALMIIVMNSGFPLGGLLGGMMSAGLIETHGWRAVFVVGGLAPLLFVPLLIVLLPESIMFRVERAARDGKSGDARSLKVLQRIAGPSQRITLDEIDWNQPVKTKVGMAGLFVEQRAFGTMLLWLAFLTSQLLFYFLVSWLPSLLVDSGLPPHRAIIGAAILNLGSVVGGLALGWLADRSSGTRVLALNYLIGGGLCLLIGQSIGQPLPLIAVLSALIGFCSGGGQLMLNALAASYYPTAIRATGMGGAGMAGRVGSIVGPVLGGGMMASGMIVSTLFVYLAVPAVLAAASVWLMNPPRPATN